MQHDCGAINFGMNSHVSDLMLKNGLYKCYILLYMYLCIMNYFYVFIIKKYYIMIIGKIFTTTPNLELFEYIKNKPSKRALVALLMV